MILPALYHWSPMARRDDIRSHGLRPFQPPVTHSDPSWVSPYICFSPTPSCAWSLSGAMEWTAEVDSWDLWQVRLEESDEVHIRPDFGPVIKEVKVFTPISSDRLWYVGERQRPVFEKAVA